MKYLSKYADMEAHIKTNCWSLSDDSEIVDIAGQYIKLNADSSQLASLCNAHNIPAVGNIVSLVCANADKSW